MKKYLLLADQISALNQQFSLKSNEIELLDILAKYYIQSEQMIVSDLIHHRDIASPSTLHTTLKSLVRKKLITAKIDKVDGRRKNISFTKLALERYRRLSSLMAEI